MIEYPGVFIVLYSFSTGMPEEQTECIVFTQRSIFKRLRGVASEFK